MSPQSRRPHNPITRRIGRPGRIEDGYECFDNSQGHLARPSNLPAPRKGIMMGPSSISSTTPQASLEHLELSRTIHNLQPHRENVRCGEHREQPPTASLQRRHHDGPGPVANTSCWFVRPRDVDSVCEGEHAVCAPAGRARATRDQTIADLPASAASAAIRGRPRARADCTSGAERFRQGNA